MNLGPCVVSTAEAVISHHAIRERAYDLWDRNHRPEGYELQFWLLAERELKAERWGSSSALPDARRM